MWALCAFLPLVAAEGGGEGGNMADFSVAMMLLASVTFMMSTFYLVNNKDEDIRKAAWLVISATISIFSAVLLFQAVNGVVEQFVLGEEPSEAEPAMLSKFVQHKILVNAGHAFVWYNLLQCVLAYISGGVSWQEIYECHYCGGSSGAEEEEDEDEENAGGDDEEAPEEEQEVDQDAKNKAQLDMKCWAVLFGHITGFASINAYGTVQGWMIPLDESERQATQHNLLMTASTPLVAFASLSILFVIYNKLREIVIFGDDGKKDPMEMMWDEETEETEDDVMGLAVSFMTVQVARFAIINTLPNEEGEVEGEQTYTFSQAGQLIFFGIFVFALHVVRTQVIKGDILSRRATEQFKVICGMVFAWCFFFGVQMFIEHLVDLEGLSDAAKGVETIKAVAVAVLITFSCYVMIFVLDKLADADFTDDAIDKSIRELIKALGILIGFAWEKSFDAAVVSVAEEASHSIAPSVTKLIMSLVICITVIPAWRWYILPQLQELGCFAEEDEEAAEEEGLTNVKPEKKGLVEPLLPDKVKEVEKNMDLLKKADQERRDQIRNLQSEAKSNAEQAKKISEQIKAALDEVVKVKEALVER